MHPLTYRRFDKRDFLADNAKSIFTAFVIIKIFLDLMELYFMISVGFNYIRIATFLHLLIDIPLVVTACRMTSHSLKNVGDLAKFFYGYYIIMIIAFTAGMIIAPDRYAQIIGPFTNLAVFNKDGFYIRIDPLLLRNARDAPWFFCVAVIELEYVIKAAAANFLSRLTKLILEKNYSHLQQLENNSVFVSV